MDSGLGSDEERRVLRLNSIISNGVVNMASTKEEKQRHNERLLIGCFIDASSLSDDADGPMVIPVTSAPDVTHHENVNNHSSIDSDQLSNQCYEASAFDNQTPKVVPQWSGRVHSTTGNSSSSSNGEEERRQGALLFRTSIPQYSMLQMELNNIHHHRLMTDSFSSCSQPDLCTEYDKEDLREKETCVGSSCDNFCLTNSTRQQSNNDPRIPLTSHSYSHNNYCCDNDVAANFPHPSIALPKNDKHRHNSTSESSTACATPFNSMVQIATGPIINEENSREDSEESKRKSEEEAENHKTSLGFYVDLNDVEEPQPSSSAPDTTQKKNIFSMVIDFEAPKKEKPRLQSSLRNGHSKSADVSRRQKHDDNSTATKRNISSAGHIPVHLATEPERKEPSPSKPSEKLKEGNNNTNNNNIGKYSDDSETDHDRESPRQFVRLSDLDTSSKVETIAEVKSISKTNSEEKHCDQHAMLDINRAGASGVMCRSIPPPPQSFVESPMFLTMSRSVAAYRSSPAPFSSQTHQRLGGVGNRASSGSSSRPSSGGGRSVARLGTDLLRMFLEEVETDVNVSVNGRKLKAHRCILVSRCQYFAASLSGRIGGSGSSSEVIIPLDGFSYDSVHFAMCHIYSGASHVPDSVSLVELASLADLLCLEGLKEVVSKELLQKHCHSFHPPCTISPKNNRYSQKNDSEGGCVEGILEVLPLAAAYGLDELYQKCLEWIGEYFVKVWPTRAFGQLPRELRDKCHRYMEVHLLPESVLITARGCLMICHSLEDRGNSRWVEVVRHLAEHLYDDCQIYLKGHLFATLEHFHRNFVCEGKDWKYSDNKMPFDMTYSSESDIVKQLEDMVVLVSRSLSSSEQICRCYIQCGKIIHDIKLVKETQSADEYVVHPLLNTLHRMQSALEEKMLLMGEKITRCPSWELIGTSMREKIIQLQIQQRQQEKDEDSSIRSTPSFKGTSPPVTRLPRATKTTQARENHAARRRQQQQVSGTVSHAPLSSSESSRNSSPLTGTRRMHMAPRDMTKSNGADTKQNKTTTANGSSGSPSLRRSLLLAARVPQNHSQVPPSPLQARKVTRVPATQPTTGSAATSANVSARTRSTLTQPTASSAAKSAPPRHIKSSGTKEAYIPIPQQKSQSAPSSVRSDLYNTKHTRNNSTTMTRSLVHSTTTKQEVINNKNTAKNNTGVRRSPDIRQNRATTPIMNRKRPGSGASSGPSNIMSPSSTTSDTKCNTAEISDSVAALKNHYNNLLNITREQLRDCMRFTSKYVEFVRKRKAQCCFLQSSYESGNVDNVESHLCTL